ncbi:hypothetical protein C8A00DRAFT_39155, partial [Chaetomidium leptoderma]
MPSNRVRKPRSRDNRAQTSSTDRRRTRAALRDALAVEMVRCTRCKEKGLPDCRVPPGDDVCSACARVNNTSCDSFGYDSSAVHLVLSQKRKLDKEQAEADQALGAALAKVDRLRRQRQVLEAKALQMFDQEGKVLREQERREASVAAPSSTGPSDSVNSSSVDLFAGVDFLSDVWLQAGPGFVDGTQSASQGSG